MASVSLLPAVFPVPIAKDGRPAKISDGFDLNSRGGSGHPGADIMYRRAVCGAKDNLPTQSRCFEMPNGVPALALAAGKVIISKEIGTGGYIMIQHPQLNLQSQYMHLRGRRVKVGETVKTGQVIGDISHNPSGYRLNHLHFQLRNMSGNLQNPGAFLAKLQQVSAPFTFGLQEAILVAGAVAIAAWFIL